MLTNSPKLLETDSQMILNLTNIPSGIISNSMHFFLREKNVFITCSCFSAVANFSCNAFIWLSFKEQFACEGNSSSHDSNNKRMWYLIEGNQVYKPTSSSVAFNVKLSNSMQEFSLDSLNFNKSAFKPCTWDNWRSRSSLTCCNSPLRVATSLARPSFCFMASSWEDY